MKTAFKIIKAFAIVLAVMIIVSIAGWLVSGVQLFGVLRGGDQVEVSEMQFDKIKKLDINLKAAKLRIVEVGSGEKIKVEMVSEYIDQWEDNETLHLVERSRGLFNFAETSEVTIYIRKDMKFDEVKLEAGAGTLDIANLRANELKLELGAGKTLIEKLAVSGGAEIDGGAGLIEIQSGEIANLDLEVGAGKADLTLKLTGSNHIKSGAGKLELDLLGNEEDYQLTFNKGLGAVKVDGQDMSDGSKWGDGKTEVKIESGVGAAEIRMIEDDGRN